MNLPSDLDAIYLAAAEAIHTADALLIGAGAGMGVDSGLPDFRGAEGFWKAYPPFRGRQFADLSTPHWFSADPALAWGFFGHRLNMYRAATPHRGFEILRRWAARVPLGAFVFTSNVDGQFQKAGFADGQILECHGSIHHLQCHRKCGQPIWPSDGVQVDVDEMTIRARSAFPTCPACGAIARPNILMFGDWDWDRIRSADQRRNYEDWLQRVDGRRVVAIEMGAGLAIPTVREECEEQSQVLIRINPREAETPPGGIALPLGAAEALGEIDARLA
ncbi:SIR2 family NAD-dependent protein deacylase [Limnoglobus roseus]|uniref:protein acetyllysine N-acetyltransferase n=1 Tax=Limnoglobus roseus TaxID=2598579 RepID=A0A5C1A9G2_9BACT|nr:Sir2 family NAD-dependent protein deacetylase [Limnoglobus roseus]QEL13754.1 NAD-dependent deacylase [Limnoglobus roseus]